MNPPKVLWPTNFSRKAQNALPYIQNLIKEKGANIHVLYVIPDIAHHESWYGSYTTSHAMRLTCQEEKTAIRRLNQLCMNYMDGCALFTRHTAVGEPAEEILRLIQTEGIDMVVMANTPSTLSDIGEPTIEKVMRMATIPVEVISA